MAATLELKIYTGTGATNETPSGDADNWNLMSSDAYDSTGTDYQTNRIQVPSSGTSYSYERWMRIKFSGSFSNITNVKFYHSGGSLSDANLDLLAGSTTSATTPVSSASSLATTTLSAWDESAEAINLTSGGAITTTGYCDYAVVQLEVPSSVTTPGDIGTQTLKFLYDES